MSTTGTVQSDAVSREQRGAHKWVALIVGLLGLQFVMSFTALYLALSDESMAIVPDYHEQALQWDQRAALQRASDALGWQSHVTIAPLDEPEAEIYKRREVMVRVIDEHKAPVSGARIELTMFPHVRPDERQQLTPTELYEGTGIYRAVATVRRDGIWELRLRVARGADLYLLTEERELQLMAAR